MINGRNDEVWRFFPSRKIQKYTCRTGPNVEHQFFPETISLSVAKKGKNLTK
jgi:hypothetical protein